MSVPDRDPSVLQADCDNGSKPVKVNLDGRDLTLELGKHFYIGAAARAAANAAKAQTDGQ